MKIRLIPYHDMLGIWIPRRQLLQKQLAHRQTRIGYLSLSRG